MAEKDSKLPENVEGPFFVDDSCIACEQCVDEAPENFSMRDDGEYAYVSKQPENEEEEELCNSAMEICPAEAIGKQE